MIRRKGKAGFVGNSIYWIKGFFFPSYSITSVTLDPPDSSLGLLSLIDDSDLGLISLITANGQGVLSSVAATAGYSSPMDGDVQSALCAIFESGQGVESTI